jgi:hypothetical protein
VYAIDSSGNGDNPLLARKTVNVATTPFGSVDVAAQSTGNDVVVAGWAIDPNTVSPIAVAVYVDGVASANVTADGSRTDVGSAYPAFGAAHGFSTTLTLSSTGSHTVDVYAIDSSGNGDNPLLARKTVSFVLT